RRAVVVAGHIGFITGAAAVRPGGETEVRTAMEHVEVERLLRIHVEFHEPGNVAWLPIAFAPVTEPTRIDFGRHRWDAGVHSPGHGKMGFFRTCIQADGHARNDNALEIAFAGPVSRVERPSNTFLDPEV